MVNVARDMDWHRGKKTDDFVDHFGPDLSQTVNPADHSFREIANVDYAVDWHRGHKEDQVLESLRPDLTVLKKLAFTIKSLGTAKRLTMRLIGIVAVRQNWTAHFKNSKPWIKSARAAISTLHSKMPSQTTSTGSLFESIILLIGIMRLQ